MTILAHTQRFSHADLERGIGEVRSRLVIRNDDGTRLGVVRYRSGDGWRFYPEYQRKPSRKGWSNPHQALKSYGIRLTDVDYWLQQYQYTMRQVIGLAKRELNLAHERTTTKDGVWLYSMYDEEYRQIAVLIKTRDRIRRELAKCGWTPKTWESERLRGLKEARERLEA